MTTLEEVVFGMNKASSFIGRYGLGRDRLVCVTVNAWGEIDVQVHHRTFKSLVEDTNVEVESRGTCRYATLDGVVLSCVAEDDE